MGWDGGRAWISDNCGPSQCVLLFFIRCRRSVLLVFGSFSELVILDAAASSVLYMGGNDHSDHLFHDLPRIVNYNLVFIRDLYFIKARAHFKQ